MIWLLLLWHASKQILQACCGIVLLLTNSFLRGELDKETLSPRIFSCYVLKGYNILSINRLRLGRGKLSDLDEGDLSFHTHFLQMICFYRGQRESVIQSAGVLELILCGVGCES